MSPPGLSPFDMKKLWKDVYEGDGKENLSLCTRMALVEEKVEGSNKNLSRLFWTSLSTLAAVLVDLVARGLFKF